MKNMPMKNVKLSRKQREALAAAMLRRGLGISSLGTAGRMTRAVACLAEAELQAAASRLLCQYPGPTEDQFAELARSAYRHVSARVGGESSWTIAVHPSGLDCAYKISRERVPATRKKAGRSAGKRGGR